MRTRELRTDVGRVFGFEVNNLAITRAGVVRTIKRMPGATITKGERCSERRHDEFCHFTLKGEKFIAEELFGDNSHFWIYAENESGFPHIAEIRGGFDRRRLFALA